MAKVRTIRHKLPVLAHDPCPQPTWRRDYGDGSGWSFRVIDANVPVELIDEVAIRCMTVCLGCDEHLPIEIWLQIPDFSLPLTPATSRADFLPRKGEKA